MKESNYNKYIVIDNNTYIYNTLTGALVKFQAERFKEIQHGINLTDELAHELERCGILTEESDEINKYLNLRTVKIDSDNTLRLVIAPTLECNFRCPYCYEKHIPIYMEPSVQNQIIYLLQKKIHEKQYKRVLVSWYGGEPLLALDIIEILSEKMITICEKNGIIYTSYMVTNGYLLRDITIDWLKKNKIQEIQVTVDGSKEVHNRRRVLYGSKKKTYNQILEGVVLCSNNNINIDIRANIDTSNKDDIEFLFKELAEIINHKKVVRVYPGKLFCMPSTETRCSNNILQQNEFVDIQILFDELSRKYGFRRKQKGLIPSFRAWYCPAPYGNSLVIAPNGDIYLCWNDIGQDQFKVGSLFQDDFFDNKRMEKWRKCGLTLSKECYTCQSLPLCGGGCVRNRVHDLGTVECDDCYSELQRILIHEMDLK